MTSMGSYQCGLSLVALRAEPELVGRVEVVRRMAAHARRAPAVARRIGAGDARVAARAGIHRYLGVRGVGFMARDARLHVAGSRRNGKMIPTVFDRDVRVAASARVGRELGRVRRVARDARDVRVGSRGQERLLRLMTTQAPGITLCDKLVRLVTAQARLVTRRLAGFLLGVAGRAGGESGECRSMPVMTIEAAAGSGVLRMLRGALGVARRAALRDDGVLTVQLVALRALRRRVHFHCGQRPLRFGVARDALGRSSVGRERVTREAVGLILRISRVRVGRLRRVALRADDRAWACEPVALEVVAAAARDLARVDVRDVTEACAVLGPRRRHHRRSHVRWSAVSVNEEPAGKSNHHRHGERRHPCESRARHEPAVWQRRHGISWCLFFVLLKPGP